MKYKHLMFKLLQNMVIFQEFFANRLDKTCTTASNLKTIQDNPLKIIYSYLWGSAFSYFFRYTNGEHPINFLNCL